MAYTLYWTRSRHEKNVCWDSEVDGKDPALGEIIEAAEKEFPEVPFGKLVVCSGGYDAEVVCLKVLEPQKSS